MTDNPGPKPSGWWRLALLGWLVHLGIGAGAVCRVLVVGPGYDRVFRDYQLHLPWLTEQVLSITARSAGLTPQAVWVLAGLAVFDALMLAYLAAWERTLWKWWFWGVLVLLLLMALIVETSLALPMIKLREALSR